MSQQGRQQPFYPSQQRPTVDKPPKKPHHVLVAIVAGIVGILVGSGVTAAVMSGDPSAKGPASVSSSATTAPTTVPTTTEPPLVEETTEPPAPTYGVPVKTDFKLTVKVLTKQCFGSAGCNVTFRILVSYTGPDLDPSAAYEVLYQVKGGEDGPIDNKLTVTGGESSVDEEEMVSIKTSKTKITAVATDVLS